MRENDRVSEGEKVRRKEREHGRGSGEATAVESESGSNGRSPMEKGGSSWKGSEPQQLKNKRKRHTMPPSNSLKSTRDKKFSVDRSAVLLPGDDVEPSNQFCEKPPSSEPQQLKNKRKRHTMPPSNSPKSTRDKKLFADRSTVLPGDVVEPSNQIFEKPPSSEPQQLKNKRKKHTMPPSNSLESTGHKKFSVDRSAVLLPGDDIEPSNQIFEKPPSSEPQQLKNKRKRHTMPPSNSPKSTRDKKLSVDRSAVLLPGDVVEPSNQIFEKPPSSEPQQLKNKRKKHTMTPSNGLESTGDKKFSVESAGLLTGDDVEPSNQIFEKPPSKRGSEPRQLKNKRKKHTMTPSNSLESTGDKKFSVDRSVVLLPGDDVEPSNQFFENSPSKRGSEPQRLKNKRKKHSMTPTNSLESTRDKKFSIDRSAVHLPGDDVEPSNQIFEKPPSSEPQQLKNKRKKHTMTPSNSLESAGDKKFSVDRSAALLPGDDVEPSNQNFEKPPSTEPQHLKNKRKRRTMPPSNSPKSTSDTKLSADRSTVLLPGDDVEPSNQIFEKPLSSEPQQLKNKRKKHIMTPSNSLESMGDKKFSDDRSAVLLPGDDVEPSNQNFEKSPSKRGAEPRQLEKERKIQKPKFPLAKSLKNKDNSFANFDSSVVPFPGDSTETSLQACKTVQIKREMVHSKPKQSGRTRQRRKAKSSANIREDDLDAPVQVGQHQLTSLDRNGKSSSLSTSHPNEEVFSASLKPAESYEPPLPKNVDSVLDNKNISRSGKRGKKSLSGRQYMECLSLQLQGDIDSSHSSVIRTRKRRKNSENVDDIPLSVSKSLMPLAENGFNSLTKTVFNDTNNYYIPSEANLDTPDCSNIKIGKEISMASKQNKEVLNTKVHENHYAKISDLPGSISNEDKDATGDLALKNVASLDVALVGMDCLPISPERALRSTFRKKLLVLDLNGILCDVVFDFHASCKPYKMVSRKAVFRRPFLDDFLTFCFEKFSVGVWSSRNKWNVAGVVDYIMRFSKDKLLFCWDQSKCTVTGFNTIEDMHKPLVLKKLIKLWNKEEASLPWEKGEYSPSNTLLVDDSPYKSLCNPPNTAIFPFPFDYRDEEDNSLGPGGDLRVYLERIAAADDVQECVKQHSFGQHAITSKDKMWSFYERIIHKNNSMALTSC